LEQRQLAARAGNHRRVLVGGEHPTSSLLATTYLGEPVLSTVPSGVRYCWYEYLVAQETLVLRRLQGGGAWASTVEPVTTTT
jgi:hypothetical protein